MTIIEEMAKAMWDSKDFCPWDEASHAAKQPCISDAKAAWEVVQARLLSDEVISEAAFTEFQRQMNETPSLIYKSPSTMRSEYKGFLAAALKKASE